MRKIALLALLLIGLAGCASTASNPGPYGNYVKNATQANERTVADDVIKKLVALYPPASTRFNLQQATPDFFGSYLVETMRTKGYAILEQKPEPKATGAEHADASTPGNALSYILDQSDATLYRVTLLINHQQSLGRVYLVAPDGAIYPAGAWARKE